MQSQDTASTLAGRRGGGSSVGHFFKSDKYIPDLASAPLMTLSQPSRDLWYSWYDHSCSYSEINLAKMPDPSKENFKPRNSNWIELLTREYIVGDKVLLHTALSTPCHWWCLVNDGQHFPKLPRPDIKLSLVGAKRL